MTSLTLPRFTLGVGDRFGHQAEAQLAAIIAAQARGIEVHPVWNKSNREHNLIGTEPGSLRAAADLAVAKASWSKPYFVDADHINLGTVDRFIDASDFFTIDVADYIGRPAHADAVEAFVQRRSSLGPVVQVEGIPGGIPVDESQLRSAAGKFLWAIEEAGRIYRHIATAKGAGRFVVEVSMDETELPQTPAELLLILAMIADEGIPAQTIAPKFSGRFNKGVDYVGDVAAFEREFDADLCVLAYAVHAFHLPASLKLSVHSGSDKFSLYPIINRLVKRRASGLHVKTAGTSWLEEVIGLAESDGEGLAVAREIYARALPRYEALVQPYAPVVDIDPARLPTIAEVNAWGPAQFADALRHDLSCAAYNPHFRQFIHVSFKVAAELGAQYTDALKANRAVVSRNVTGNLLDRHLVPLFA
jgi:tagaturonate epimerase